MTTRLIAALSFTLTMSVVSFSSDWPRFRGDNGSGISTDSIPLVWDKEHTKWSIELPGEGNGSPIVVKGKIYLQTASSDGQKRGLACINSSTGELIWHTLLTGKTAHIHQKNSLASSTPACDGERVYAVFWDGSSVALHAFDLAGKQLWEKKLGDFASQHGPGFSPIVVSGKVIVNYDQDKLSSIVAFDAKTGNEVWKASRKAFRACYSTPFVRGNNDVVVSSTAGLTAYNADTGAVTWNWDWQFDGMALRTVGSPVDAGKSIIAISGDGNGARHTVVVQPEGNSAKMLWDVKKDSPYVPGPVVHEGHIYWVTDAGLAMAVELTTGKVLWKERILNGSVSASLLMIQQKGETPLVLTVSEKGEAVFFKAQADKFEQVGSNKLKEPVFATPAIADSQLLIRAGKKLFCFANKSSN